MYRTLGVMASTGEAWRLGRRPALDGVRGVAIVLVLVGHSGVPPFANAGAVGVDLFFVLSGFLITSLLLEELDAHGRVRVGDFYRRRALRLLPALVALIVGVWVIRLVLGLGAWWVSLPGTAAALLYSTNIWIFHGSSGTLSHTWSLSLEEQFYIAWPPLLVMTYRVGRRRVVLTVAGVLGAASLISLYLSAQPLWSFAPPTRACYLLFGCAVAASMTGRTRQSASRNVVAACSGTLLLASSVAAGGIAGLAAPVTIALGAVMLVWLAARERLSWLEGRTLAWLGRRSYGIYLWHYPLMVLALRVTDAWPVVLITVAGGGIALAAVSWRYVETPFLRLKDRSMHQAVLASR